MPICPSCGRETEGRLGLCTHCGAELSAAREGRVQRKTVTILFCDLVHSTGLVEGDPETFRRLQSRFFAEMSAIVERHGGTVEKFIGDEVMAVFGVPALHEDDALRAVRAAREMLDRLAELNDEPGGARGLGLQARIGVNTGEVLAGDPTGGHSFVAGEPVVLAKRLEQAAEPGEILIGRSTYPLVEHAVVAGPLERIPVKGKREEVGRRRIEEVDREAPGVARRLHAPIIGRDEELRLLGHAFERAVQERSCRLFTVLGPAGIGKSRLAAELMSSLEGRATSAVGRCLSYGEGIAFWPLTQVLRGLGGEEAVAEALVGGDLRETVLERVAGLASTSEAGSTEETFWAVRRAFEAFARQRPLVFCLEDVHWAEPMLLDFVEYLVGWSSDAPILVVALARPELVEVRPQWITPRPEWDSLALEPLSDAEAASLLAGLSEEVPLSAEQMERIAAAAEGNPLFVEQMSALAAEEGGKAELSTPPSIQALLGERLDRLGEDERQIIERASVIGRDFPVSALAGIATERQRASLTRNLLALARKGLIRPDPEMPDEDRFTFQHVLVRDAAYEAMPKELRATLNERFAWWLEERGTTPELEPIVGYHLEQAHWFRVDLGLRDDHTGRLGDRAAELLGGAGTRALGRNDVQAALKLLRRAVALRLEDDPAVTLRLDLSQALFQSGELAGASATASDTAARAAAFGDDVGELRARIAVTRIKAQTPPEDVDGEGASAELLVLAERARSVFAAAGDELALGEAWLATAWAELSRCRFGNMLEAVDRAGEHFDRAGVTGWDRELPAWKGTARFYGPTRVEDVLAWYREQQSQHPIALAQEAMLEAMLGNFDEARRLARSADAVSEDLGQEIWLAAGGMAVWEIETLAGDDAAAESASRRSCELLEEIGDTSYQALATGYVAASRAALGRLEEAEESTRTAEALSATDDVVAQIVWRVTRAQVLACRGEHAEAERLAREAVALGERTDMLNWHGNALAGLAEVDALAARAGLAREHLEQAIELYERKGNVVAVARARRRLSDLTAAQ